MTPLDQSLIRAENLKKFYSPSKRVFQRRVPEVRAVDGVSFEIKRSETLGLVGESGCGKSTTGRCLIRLVEPTDGKIYYQNTDVTSLNSARLRAYRRQLQIIFQDPFSSLNPRLTVDTMLREILKIHRLAEGTAASSRALQLMEMVDLPAEALHKFPHEFSGGQRQRIGIARALAVEPKFIVCDEPVSALDVSIQAQIVNLLNDLQKNLSLTYLFIAHDLAIVRHISDRVAVMYLGKIVESAETEELYHHPQHPYTHMLFAATPVPDPDSKKIRAVPAGEIPGAPLAQSGCSFHPRCAYVKSECREIEPELKEVKGNHFVSCHFPLGY